MRSFLNKIFSTSNNLNSISQKIRCLSKKTPVNKIFEAINSYSSESEIRYVGGCIRKIIKNESIDDIDLATNLEPSKVCEILKGLNISFYETGIEHGTVTALIDDHKFEITSLREDVSTDGRHAKVKFSKSWKEDAARRDFTINSIYSDKDGNLFDPHNGKSDLEKGIINFIGDADIRIKEDYIRILRYIRFFLLYSKQPHNSEITRILKMNINGILKISKERLLIELKKMIKFEILNKISKDKISLNLILIIFPELKNIKILSKLNSKIKDLIKDEDFIFFLSLMIIDGTDNTDYFLYKFNISKKNKKRIKVIDNFFKKKITKKMFSEKDLNRIFYFEGKQAVNDILLFRIIKTKFLNDQLIRLMRFYRGLNLPKMPIKAEILMAKYKVPEGKQLGSKLKKLEEEWLKNNFKISNQQVEQIMNN